jgi:hypothetical protein
MRKLYFLVPGTDRKFACGGLWAELKTLKLAQQVCQAELVTYRQREPNTLYLPDVLQQPNLEDVIFVISWGFHISELVKQLQHCHVVYHAHSAGYGFRLPSRIPIITVSRNTMGYWGQKSPNALIYYLPNQISENFQNLHLERDIDVLVQSRKSSKYLMQSLVPALQEKCRVMVLDSHVEDLGKLFNQTKIYLYDSAEYWAQQRAGEGFGLPPLEAMACGCQVFSSVNGALADYLDPGFNCHKIAVYSKEYDVQRILRAIASAPAPLPESFFEEYRSANILKRFEIILSDLNEFFDHKRQHPANIQELTRWRLSQLFFNRVSQKLKKRLSR